MGSISVKKLRTDARTHHKKGNVVAALQALDRIISLNAASSMDWCMTGALLNEIGEYAQAIGAFENCLKIEPGNVEALYDLGKSLYKLGDGNRASGLLEKAALATGLTDVWMGLATIAPGVQECDHANVKRIREKFAAMVRHAESPLLPSYEDSVQDSNAFNNETSPQRIGYLSAHWHDANYMKPVWPLINAHYHEHFKIHLLDDSTSANPDWQWLTNRGVESHRVVDLSNRDLAKFIREVEIDVLVDLSAYSKPERLGVYVHRPARVQAAWFNMYATSGFNEFDYIIGDDSVVLPEEESHYCERVLRLPLSYLTFQTNHVAPEVAIDPLRTMDQFTFGCLGTQYKITPQVIEVWSKILKVASSAQLLLANRELKSPCNRAYVLDQFLAHGVSSERIKILPPANHFEFLKYYDQIDLALDTFPYNGGTTTMEALWQGVPVLTFSGDRWASRTSQSILAHSHLSQFVSTDCEEYLNFAIRYATEQAFYDSLKPIRQNMRKDLMESAACDSIKLARAMESLYRSI
jgi:protein O-GlcNAc transferase